KADRRVARPTSSVEQRIAEYGNVVVPANRHPAGRTPRAGKDDRFAGRQSRNTHIEEASDHETENQQENDAEECHWRANPGGSGRSGDRGDTMTRFVEVSNS